HPRNDLREIIAVLLYEVTRHRRGENADHPDTCKHEDHRYYAALKRDGRYITIAHGRNGHERPPQRVSERTHRLVCVRLRDIDAERADEHDRQCHEDRVMELSPTKQPVRETKSDPRNGASPEQPQHSESADRSDAPQRADALEVFRDEKWRRDDDQHEVEPRLSQEAHLAGRSPPHAELDAEHNPH